MIVKNTSDGAALLTTTMAAMEDARNATNGQHNVTVIEHDDSERVIGAIMTYSIPVIVSLGSLGNFLSILVFFSTKLRKLSSSYYLSALAVSDTGFLFCTLITYLPTHDIGLFNQEGVCQITTYFAQITICPTLDRILPLAVREETVKGSVAISQFAINYWAAAVGASLLVFGFLSPWFIVAFTVERFIAVRYPLKRTSMCTVSRAKAVLAVLSILAVGACLPFLFLTGIATKHHNITEEGEVRMEMVEICQLLEGHEKLAETLNHLDTIVTLIIPFLIIVSLNTLISRTVCRVARVRRSMTKSTGTGGRQSAKQRTSSSQTKVTEMLLVVSTVFIVLNLPSYAIRMYVYINQKGEEERAVVVIQQYAQLLFYINFGINFVLYCVSGQNFRRALISLFCPEIRRRAETTQVTTVVSEYTRSASTRRTVTVNGNWREAHEMVPINRPQHHH